jgi:hypothetical protein
LLLFFFTFSILLIFVGYSTLGRRVGSGGSLSDSSSGRKIRS